MKDGEMMEKRGNYEKWEEMGGRKGERKKKEGVKARGSGVVEAPFTISDNLHPKLGVRREKENP